MELFVTVSEALNQRIDAAVKVSLERTFRKSEAASGCLVINGKFSNMVNNSARKVELSVDR
jgi:hypothetical protein